MLSAVFLAAAASTVAAYGGHSSSVISTYPDLRACAAQPSVFSCENTTVIENTCCSPTPGGLVLQTQFWSTWTGLEKKGQKLPKGSWTLHGLWPDNASIPCDGSFESYCDASRQYDPTPDASTTFPAWTGPGIDTFVEKFGRYEMLDWMNKYWINQGAPNADFWAHEFSKHATCTSTFDVKCYGPNYKQHQEVVDFFDAVIRAFKQYPTFDMLAAFGITPSNSTTYSLSQIQTALQSQTGAVPFLGCKNGTILSEVWYFSHVFGTESYGTYKPLDSTTKTTCNASLPIQYLEPLDLTMITLNFGSQKGESATRRALSELSLSVAKSKKIVVVTGAGISCSSGIPDFRSSDGLYALVKEKYPDVVLKGRDLFDASLFRDPTSTAVFHTFIAQLKQSIDAAEPGPTHHFIQTLDSKKKLVRSYTQNIDGFEARVGLLSSATEEAKGKGKARLRVKDVKNVQLHGDIHSVRCRSCSAEYPCTQAHLDVFLQGGAPECPECLARADARAARCARSIKVGVLRPAIVLYDEPHPFGEEISAIQTADVGRKPDMLIIMGTSLKVHGLKKLVKDFAKTVHAHNSPGKVTAAKKHAGKVIFVNRTPPSSEWAGIIDYHVEGTTDEWVERVVEDWKRMRPADWEVQKTLVAAENGDVSMSSPFKVVATTKNKVAKKDTKKKPRTNGENVPPPPEPIPMELGSPEVVIVEKRAAAAIAPPLSPSKRRQANSHYTPESSPSKRRTLSPMKGLDDSSRGLLFTAPTSKTKPTSKMDVDLFDDDEHRPVKPVPQRRTKRAVPAADL
ncbi:HST3 protein [Mycena kentingensis (nom. inval.)]|nr:HST3 protein [Mycena kentingensis (nom. inval.)]